MNPIIEAANMAYEHGYRAALARMNASSPHFDEIGGGAYLKGRSERLSTTTAAIEMDANPDGVLPGQNLSARMNRHTGMWEGPEEYPEEIEVLGILHEDPDVVADKVLEVVARICDERDRAREALTHPAANDQRDAPRSVGHLKAALGVARMALRQHGGLDMRIAGNGPTVGEAIEKALAGAGE